MNVTLNFNLPDDQEQYEVAYKAMDFYDTLSDMDKWLRNSIKYAPESSDKIKIQTLEETRDMLYKFLDKYNIILE